MLKFFRAKVGFYSERLLNLATLEESKIDFLATIVGREHCYECFRDIPVVKKEEVISAALHMDDIAPFAGKRFFFVENISSDTSRIHFFVIRQEVYDRFSTKSLFIIPESLLLFNQLFKQADKNVVVADALGRNISAIYNNQLFASSVASAGESSAVLPHQFVIETQDVKTIEYQDGANYYNDMLTSCFRFPWYVNKQLFNERVVSDSIRKIPTKAVALTVLTVFLVYQGMMSAWLFAKGSSLEKELSTQRESLNQVFELQSSLNNQQEIQQSFVNNKKLSSLTSGVWQVLIPLVENNVELLSVNYFDNKYTIRVKAKKATDVIEFLSNQSTISEPKQESAVVKSRGKEIITLTFSLIKEK